MNALEKNFLRVVFGWSFISSDKGFEIKTPMSFSYAPKTLFKSQINLDELTLENVADLLHDLSPEARSLNLHASCPIEDVESLLRSASYPNISGWFAKVESLGIKVGASDNGFTKQFNLDPRFFKTQTEMSELAKDCTAITIVPLPLGNWGVWERQLCDDYKVGGHPATELIGWWSNGLQINGMVANNRPVLIKELELWFCKHPIQ